jgi:hypothetical protein
MAKINETNFQRATRGAELKTKSKTADDELQRYIAVYDVPKLWIRAIKSNKKNPLNNTSAYTKQALLEKLERDGLI